MPEKVFEGWKNVADRLNSGEVRLTLTPSESEQFNRAIMCEELNRITTERIDIIIN